MKLSIRNRFDATVDSVTAGPAMTTVKTHLASGQPITAAITTEAATELGLTAGDRVLLLIKATEVSVAVDPPGRVSIRNLLRGTLTTIDNGEAMTTLKVQLPDGDVLTAVITRESTDDLELTTGMALTALVKSTDVAVATA